MNRLVVIYGDEAVHNTKEILSSFVSSVEACKALRDEHACNIYITCEKDLEIPLYALNGIEVTEEDMVILKQKEDNNETIQDVIRNTTRLAHDSGVKFIIYHLDRPDVYNNDGIDLSPILNDLVKELKIDIFAMMN